MAHTISLRISLAGGGWLDLNDGTYFRIVDGLALTAQRWRRRTVEGTYVEGRTLLGAVRDQETKTAVIKVMGDTHAQLEANTSTMFAALSQIAYTAEVTVNGVTRTWVCEPADIDAAKGGFDKHQAARPRPAQTYVVSISHKPV